MFDKVIRYSYLEKKMIWILNLNWKQYGAHGNDCICNLCIYYLGEDLMCIESPVW